MAFLRSKLYAESWNVAWREKGQLSILTDHISEFHVISNSMRYWAADPFILDYNQETYIFAELYDYVRRRGVIGYCKLKEGKWKPIIVEKNHLSYPYVYREGNNIYIIPEANESDNLYIYECIHFPDIWKKEVVREKVKYADTTPFLYGRCKFALTFDINDKLHPELVLLNLQNKDGDERIAIDNTELRRPAGKMMEDLQIRPAQNCRNGYGSGLVFYKYDLDARGKFKESEIQRINPDELSYDRKIYIEGMHTYNSTEKYEVIDIKTRRLNLLNLFFRIWGKMVPRV